MSDDFVRRLFLHEPGVVVFFKQRPEARASHAADSLSVSDAVTTAATSLSRLASTRSMVRVAASRFCVPSSARTRRTDCANSSWRIRRMGRSRCLVTIDRRQPGRCQHRGVRGNRIPFTEWDVAEEKPYAKFNWELAAMSNDQSSWLTVGEAAQHARCGVKTVYREVQAGRLRAARVGGRRELRFRLEWVDAWLERTAGVEVGAGRAELTAGL